MPPRDNSPEVQRARGSPWTLTLVTLTRRRRVTTRVGSIEKKGTTLFTGASGQEKKELSKRKRIERFCAWGIAPGSLGRNKHFSASDEIHSEYDGKGGIWK